MLIKDALHKSYEDFAPLSQHWKKEIKEHDFTADLLIANLKNLSNKRILDIGCGLGIFVRALSLLGAKAEGVDKHILNEWGLQGVQEMWNKKNVNITVGDFMNVPFNDNIFDAIIAENIFEHLQYTQREFLEKIYKMLIPGGYLILATPNLASALKRTRALAGKSSYWDLKDFFFNKQPYGHIREFTSDELRQIMRWAGFENIVIKTNNTYFKLKWFRNIKKYPAAISWVLSGIFPNMRDTLFVVAQKL